MTDPQHEETFADTERKLREIITTLRAQLAEAKKDADKGAKDYCDLMERHDAEKVRADRAEAALAAQIEALHWLNDNATLKPQARKCVQSALNQPHDRTALGRHDAKTREKALREAAKTAHECNMAGDPQASSTYILALIEKEKTE